MTAPENEKTLDIARRTRKNLEYIYKAKRQGEDVEEFTQLLNSMLGMVISLREEYFRDSQITWQYVQQLDLKSWKPDLKIRGKVSSSQSPNLRQVNLFSQLMTNIRHAFAHSNFDLIVDPAANRITGVKVWNTPTGKGKVVQDRTWEADIFEDQLRDLAYLFVEYLEKELAA